MEQRVVGRGLHEVLAALAKMPILSVLPDVDVEEKNNAKMGN